MRQEDYPWSRDNAPFEFDLVPIKTQEVNDALIKLNAKKSSGPDGLDPLFLKIAAEHNAEPLTHNFNLTIETGVVPCLWKSACHSFIKGWRPIKSK